MIGFKKLKLFLSALIDASTMVASAVYFVPMMIPPRNCWQVLASMVTAASWNC